MSLHNNPIVVALGACLFSMDNTTAAAAAAAALLRQQHAIA
jgi:hypothetical protein